MKKLIQSAFLAVAVVPVFMTGEAKAQAASPMVWGVQIEELEHRFGDEDERVNVWNADAFVGNDEFRARWLSEGEYDDVRNRFEGLENRFVGQIPISDFFDAKAGVRFDTPNGKNQDRTYAVLGIAGLAKQWFEIDADLFYSDKRNLSARLDAEYELLVTNKLILTPSVDLNYAFTDDTEIELKSGFSSLEAGARLSYDLVDRMISPYVGVVYERKLGNTADFVKAEGEDYEAWFGTIGLKMVF